MRGVNSASVLLFVLAIGGLLALPACSSSSSTTQPALVPDRGSPISDVPVPAGFTLQTDKDTWYKGIPGSNQRFVHHIYRGSDNYLAVMRFYKEQMPKFGWTGVSELQLGDTVTLRFTKNAEPVTVTIKNETFHTYITIQINLDRG